MPTILRRLPYSDRRTSVVVRGREEEVKATQIIIWASITEVGHRELDATTPKVPVILDTGLSHNFAIMEDQLSNWAGIERRYLRKLRDITIGGQVVPLHEAEVWLHFRTTRASAIGSAVDPRFRCSSNQESQSIPGSLSPRQTAITQAFVVCSGPRFIYSSIVSAAGLAGHGTIVLVPWSVRACCATRLEYLTKRWVRRRPA